MPGRVEMVVNRYCSYRSSPGRGVGVFARRQIEAGTVILQDLCRRIGSHDAQVVCATSLRNHLFADRDPLLKEQGERGLQLAFGASSIINHSNEENCRLDWKSGEPFPRVLAVTTRDIAADEEIYIKYADLESYQREDFV
ncbi:SET domain-containing protein-lysine N-methyltransferase [Stappia sp. ES.058]|uniref:SET domain-containing protein-lysine N-methyltransferase n=1 Tax=Stappia sp. ES.058 TaxID=1881061 RepID=UPI00087B92D5|nr:SET domain-containing protein-lysine N-methyltransferase [Stappia sp. ES.058]SDU18651.1 SET domain-containing protein [Stappia sp. ES.058]